MTLIYVFCWLDNSDYVEACNIPPLPKNPVGDKSPHKSRYTTIPLILLYMGGDAQTLDSVILTCSKSVSNTVLKHANIFIKAFIFGKESSDKQFVADIIFYESN